MEPNMDSHDGQLDTCSILASRVTGSKERGDNIITQLYT